jgi:hypothetical protein
MEQQALISLAATIETLVVRALRERGVRGRPNYTFGAFVKGLEDAGIKPHEFKHLVDPAVFGKVRDAFDYLFRLRNLIVHNGGIVDEEFYERYRKRSPQGLKVGSLIRVGPLDQNALRGWTSLFIQELCRNLPGYEAVWTDYVQAVGIFLPGFTFRPEYFDGTVGPETELREGG